MENWDDLRYVLAIARHGTILEAAKAMRVNASTMSRRLRAIEASSETQLFEKFKHGVVLSAAGQEMVTSAELIEHLYNDLDARIHGLDAKLEGSLRVTSTDILLKLWMPDIAGFSRQHPNVALEFTSGYSAANLTRREADVAIRMSASAPEHLVGRKHCEILYAVYGSHELVERVGPAASYAAYPWLGWDLSVGRATDRFIDKRAKGARVTMRVDRMEPMMAALEAGVGITIMPCLCADTNPKLRRVGDYFEGGFWIWVLTHPELRGAARVRSFTRSVAEWIERDRELIEGRRPQSAR